MALPQDTSGVIVARDSDLRALINSYTVDPALLFVRSESMAFVVDQPNGESSGSEDLEIITGWEVKEENPNENGEKKSDDELDI